MAESGTMNDEQQGIAQLAKEAWKALGNDEGKAFPLIVGRDGSQKFYAVVVEHGYLGARALTVYDDRGEQVAWANN